MLKPGQNHSLLPHSPALQRALPACHNANLCSAVFPFPSPLGSCSRSLLPDLQPIPPLPMSSPNTSPAALPHAAVVLQAQPQALLTTPKSKCCSRSLTASMAELREFGIWWFCGMGLRSDPYEDKFHLNFSFEWDPWALSQRHWSTALPLLQRRLLSPAKSTSLCWGLPALGTPQEGQQQLSCTCLD